MTFAQAIVIGLLQGVTELFPVSSLGHSVILPALLGWTNVVAAQSAAESFFLAFLVGLRVATALALLFFFRADWARIVRGFIRSALQRKIETSDERLGWLLIIATVPAGLLGLALEHSLRVLFATPLIASILLIVNGFILLAGENVRRHGDVRRLGQAHPSPGPADRRLATLEFREAGLVGFAQVVALFPGISRSGITMVLGWSAGWITRPQRVSAFSSRRR